MTARGSAEEGARPIQRAAAPHHGAESNGTRPGLLDAPRALALPVLPPRPGRTRRNLRAVEWRARVLHAARSLFAERGYDNTTMEDIAAFAGCSRARLYCFFPGRRELFDALIAEDAQALAGELLLELSRTADVAEQVRAVVAVFFRHVQERRERHRVLYSDASHNDPALAELMRTVRGAVADTLGQHLVRSLPRASRKRPAELRLMAHAVIAMAEGAATAWASEPRLDLERSIDVVSQVALRALTAPQRPATAV